jgi:hypothetical protein
MDSADKPAPTGAEDVLLGQGEAKQNGDYERVVREELARVQERLAQLAPVAAPVAASLEVKVTPEAVDTNSSSANKLDANITAFRAADVTGAESGRIRPSRGRGFARVLNSLVVAGIVVGAGAAWASYGEAIKPAIASWEPQIGQVWSLVSERLGLSGQQATPPAQAATADTAAPPAAPPQAAAAPQVIAPPVAAAPQASAPQAAAAPSTPESAEVEQMLQGMARDIASLQQGIDQLKAGQEQMARENAKLAEQLRVSQEQLSRVARASEQNLHPRPLPAKPPVTAARRPMPPAPAPIAALPPPQAIAPPVQTEAETYVPGAPRPPKPVP